MKSNTRFKKNTKGIECLNCEQPISNVDNFCSNCGQVNDTKPLSIKQYITELLGGFFAFDTRTINTIKPLLFNPGKVTKEYIKGERMKYVNPFQLYLHVSIIFFLVTGVFMSIDRYNDMLSTNGKSIKNEKKGAVNNFMTGWNSVPNKDQNNSVNSSVIKQIIKESKDLTNKEVFLNTINNSQLSVKQKENIIDTLLINKISRLYAKSVQNNFFKTDSLYDYDKFTKTYIASFQKELAVKNIDYKVTFQKENDIITSSFWLKKYTYFFNSKTKDVGAALDSLGYERTDKNIFFFKKLQDFKKVTKGGDAGRSFSNNMISKSSLVMFFMLPLFTLFLRLVYIRRKNNYTEHLIFVFNVQTVFFILLLLGIIFDRVFPNKEDIYSLVSLFLFLFYLYKAMRKFYNQGRIKTIIKYFILNFVYLLISSFGLITVAFLAFVM